MEPHFNKITKYGYDKIASEIRDLENSRPAKLKIWQMPGHSGTSRKMPSIVLPKESFVIWKADSGSYVRSFNMRRFTPLPTTIQSKLVKRSPLNLWMIIPRTLMKSLEPRKLILIIIRFQLPHQLAPHY